MKNGHRGFTIIELLVVIIVISLLITITIVGYGAWRYRVSDNEVQTDVKSASSSLEAYRNFSNDFPPNLAGTGFAASPDVALTLKTNAPQTRVYTSLTPDQNAQLLLNTCNANMPITSGGTTYNTSCVFSGNNFHIKGTSSSNVVIQGPTFDTDIFVLTCGNACDDRVTIIKQQFAAQGGSFPVTVPKNQVAMPEPTMQSYGTSNRYCLEGTTVNFSDIVYHISNGEMAAQSGPCPPDSELHYP